MQELRKNKRRPQSVHQKEKSCVTKAVAQPYLQIIKTSLRVPGISLVVFLFSKIIYHVHRCFNAYAEALLIIVDICPYIALRVYT